MSEIVHIAHTGALADFRRAPDLPLFDASALARVPPDAHLALVDGGTLLAHGSLWWRNTPVYQQHRVGLIGHYGTGGEAAAREWLPQAEAALRAQGCTLAVGPMDGSTLHRYRFVVERGSEPPFLMEPDQPDDWPRHWEAAGYAPLAHYYSAVHESLDREDPRLPGAEARLRAAGVSIRPLRDDDFAGELRRIYAVSAVSFRANFLYTPFTAQQFLDLYLPFQRFGYAGMSLLAEHDGAPVGFIFNVPDLTQRERGEAPDTLIIKTVAVLPGRAYAGLGSVLVARSHRLARAQGFRRAIHALMHEHNASRHLSGRYARPIRRYALFAKVLQS